jgi:tetratricopeptide (TPR) repeat protein
MRASTFLPSVRARSSRRSASPSNRAAVAEIVRMLDGLPLAIELAAARIAVFPPAELSLRLRDRFRWLGGMRGAVHRQSTLLAAIDWSWQLLKSWEQAALAQYSTFEGTFTLDAAEAVVDIAAFAEAVPAADVAQALCDKSLLRTIVLSPLRGGAGETRLFAMYISIRDYAAAKLAAYASGLQRAAEARHCAYFARFGTEEAIEALAAPGGVQRRRALAQQLDNLSLACRRAIDCGDAARAVDTYAAAWAVLDLSGPNESGVALGAQVLAMSGLTSNQRIRAVLRYAVALRRVNRGEESAQRLMEALTLLPSASDPRLEASLLATLAGVRADQNRMGEASTLAEAALRLADETGNDGLAGTVHNNLGIYDAERGRYDAARAHLEAALALHQRTGDRRSEGMDTVNLATVLRIMKQTREAIVHFERALSIHIEVGDRRNEGLALANLGMLYRDEMRLDEAQERCEHALAVHREVGNRFAEGTALAALGEIYWLQGRHSDAAAALRAGEILLREVNDKLGLVTLLCHRAHLELTMHDRERAHVTLAQAESIIGELGLEPDSEPRRKVAQLRALLS